MIWGTHRAGRLGIGDLGIGPTQLRTLVDMLVLASRRARPIVLGLKGGFDENIISIEVHKQLQAVQNRWNVRYLEFHPEGILNPPDGPPAKITGRIDFLIKVPDHFGYPEAYFGVEAKRIALKDRDLMRYYMDGGIRKFADGTYSKGHPEAMLLGYLVTPPSAGVPAAIAGRLLRLHGSTTTLAGWGRTYRDSEVVAGMLPRKVGHPIRILHAIVRMHR